MESLPLLKLNSSPKDIHAKTRKALQNTDIDMQEILETDKALQFI